MGWISCSEGSHGKRQEEFNTETDSQQLSIVKREMKTNHVHHGRKE